METIEQIVGSGYSAFWTDKHFYRVVKGSRGSKKSKTTALNMISRIMEYPWANILVIRRYANTNRQSTYADLEWAINRLNAQSLFKCNSSLPEITYTPTGQKILFRGLDNPLKITSITVKTGSLSFVWVEEAYEIENSDKFETVVESIRGSNSAPDFFKQITVTFNPWSENSWLKKKFWDKETRYDGVFAQTTTFRCNEWLTKADKKRYLDLYRTNPARARIVCDGEWGVAEGLVFSNFNVHDFDIHDIKQNADTLAYGMDFGLEHDPTTMISVAIIQKTRDIYVFDEMYRFGMTNDEVYQFLADNGYTNTTIVADSAEDRLIQWLSAKGIRRIRKSWKPANSVNMGIRFLKNYNIHILPSCEHTVSEFNSYVYKKNNHGEWTDQPADANNHLIDPLRYALEPYIMPKRKSPNYKQSIEAWRKLGAI